MNRRRFIVGAGSATLLAGGGVLALGRDSSGGETLSSVDVSVIDAPSSSDAREETIRLPPKGSTTVIDLFSTNCTACDDQIKRLESVKSTVPASVRFFSVTNQSFYSGFTKEDLREWWDVNGGQWPVCHDPEGQLIRSFGTPAIPYTVVVGPSGKVGFEKSGVTSPQTVAATVERFATQ